VGGDLFVYINDQKERVNIEIGQTVVLPSDLDHEVSIVETGEREVLINWLRFRN
jgi:predicted 2-oxoglutarate/Fe(II)-dependent dioxygenase YbiX